MTIFIGGFSNPRDEKLSAKVKVRPVSDEGYTGLSDGDVPWEPEAFHENLTATRRAKDAGRLWRI